MPVSIKRHDDATMRRKTTGPAGPSQANFTKKLYTGGLNVPDFKLYNYYRSSASYRVRIALHLKGIPFEYHAVHLVKNGGEQHRDEYRKLNPSREVPTLVHGDRVLGQSMAIIQYVDQVQPEPALFPKDPYERALVVQACEIINSGAQPVYNLRVLNDLEKNLGATQEKKNEWIARWVTYGLESYERFVEKRAGRFSFGDQVTAADCFVVPHFFAADRFQVPTSQFTIANRIRANCNELEAFKKAAPAQQPDFE